MPLASLVWRAAMLVCGCSWSCGCFAVGTAGTLVDTSVDTSVGTSVDTSVDTSVGSTRGTVKDEAIGTLALASG